MSEGRIFYQGKPLAAHGIEDTLIERQQTHGDYTETARLAQELKETLRAGFAYGDLSSSHREALDLIATKLARILSGNPREPDHWRDIAGYARLAELTCD